MKICSQMSFYDFLCTIFHNEVIVGSSIESDEEKDCKQTEMVKKLTRRTTSEIEGYIIDPIPKFSDENKNFVIESWPFLMDHIREVGKHLDFMVKLKYCTFLPSLCIPHYSFFNNWYLRLDSMLLRNSLKYHPILQSHLHFSKPRMKSFTIFYPNML